MRNFWRPRAPSTRSPMARPRHYQSGELHDTEVRRADNTSPESFVFCKPLCLPRQSRRLLRLNQHHRPHRLRRLLRHRARPLPWPQRRLRLPRLQLPSRSSWLARAPTWRASSQVPACWACWVRWRWRLADARPDRPALRVRARIGHATPRPRIELRSETWTLYFIW